MKGPQLKKLRLLWTKGSNQGPSDQGGGGELHNITNPKKFASTNPWFLLLRAWGGYCSAPLPTLSDSALVLWRHPAMINTIVPCFRGIGQSTLYFKSSTVANPKFYSDVVRKENTYQNTGKNKNRCHPPPKQGFFTTFSGDADKSYTR